MVSSFFRVPTSFIGSVFELRFIYLRSDIVTAQVVGSFRPVDNKDIFDLLLRVVLEGVLLEIEESVLGDAVNVGADRGCGV